MRDQTKKLIRMNNHKEHVPIRTCISCRSKKAKKELIRLVLDKKNQIVIDEYQKKNGRGIYLCNEKSCMERFSKNKGPGQFFRTDKSVTMDFNLM